MSLNLQFKLSVKEFYLSISFKQLNSLTINYKTTFINNLKNVFPLIKNGFSTCLQRLKSV